MRPRGFPLHTRSLPRGRQRTYLAVGPETPLYCNCADYCDAPTVTADPALSGVADAFAASAVSFVAPAA